MKIRSIRIENFRSFRDETFGLNKYSCFVGPNGAGKSSILAALNIFFRDQSSGTFDTAKLEDEDYFCRNTANPVRITVTFDDLNQAAQAELSDYVRQNELTITAEAQFDQEKGYGLVKHFGQRLGFEEFRVFFEKQKAGVSAAELKEVFTGIRQQFEALPNATSTDARAGALRTYEAEHPEHCVLIPSDGQLLRHK